MIVYKTVCNGDYYKIFCNGLLTFSAIRKSRFFGDKVILYNAKQEEIINVKHRYFILLGFGHKVTFLQNNVICYIKSKGSYLNLFYKENLYSIKYNLLGKNENLYLNGQVEGKYKNLKSDLTGWEHEITCNLESSCFVFTIMDIADDWFDVN